jgi:hypothetical protein
MPYLRLHEDSSQFIDDLRNRGMVMFGSYAKSSEGFYGGFYKQELKVVNPTTTGSLIESLPHIGDLPNQ